MLREWPDARINVPLPEVVVRAEHIGHPHTRALPGDVFEFVDRMLETGRYPRRALPRDAVTCAAVYLFMSTFESDGLHVFIETIGWDEAVRDDVREGLEQLGFRELAAVFAGLEDFVASADPDFFEESGWWEDPALEEVDGLFPPGDLLDRHYDQLADWIQRWPYLRGVPAAQIQTVLGNLAERNLSPPGPAV